VERMCCCGVCGGEGKYECPEGFVCLMVGRVFGCDEHRTSTDSGLEAFSHNPTDDSLAALACRPAAKTSDLNQRFLSY